MAKILKLNYNVPIIEKSEIKEGVDFTIAGVAINATITANNHKFLADELRTSASSLNGVPLLVDHRNEISAIKGRVILGEFDETNQRVNFKAMIKDKEIKQMVSDGLINSVSVGATVKEIEEADGVLIPKGIEFKELSLVAVPADAGATFGVALSEAYKVQEEDEEEEDEEVDEAMKKCKNCGKMIDSSKMEKHLEKCKAEEKLPENKEAIMASQVSNNLKGGIEMSEETEQSKPEVAKVDEVTQSMQKMLEKMNAMQEELKAMKAEKSKAEVQEKAEVAEVEETSKYRIESGIGSLRGNSFTLVR